MTGWWGLSPAPPAWSLWMLPCSPPMRPTDFSPLPSHPRLDQIQPLPVPKPHTNPTTSLFHSEESWKLCVGCCLALWKFLNYCEPSILLWLSKLVLNISESVRKCFQTTLHDCVCHAEIVSSVAADSEYMWFVCESFFHLSWSQWFLPPTDSSSPSFPLKSWFKWRIRLTNYWPKC